MFTVYSGCDRMFVVCSCRASVIDEDGKAYKLQSGPILEADPVKPTTAEPDQDEESEDEDGRRPGEEQEQPATPNET